MRNVLMWLLNAQNYIFQGHEIHNDNAWFITKLPIELVEIWENDFMQSTTMMD